MHWDGSPSQLFVAPIVDFCAFWLLLTLVLILAAEGYESRYGWRSSA